jgi:asparagine synthase (glutamine-hydrolysing)
MNQEDFSCIGSYQNPSMGIFVGWISHKDSFSASMPVWNENSDIALIFSGENFMPNDAMTRLKNAGHEFDGSSADYLVHLYEENGDGFFELLNGWFSGLLIDLRRKRVVLFNDRFGMSKVCYHENGEEFLFSSEAKALLAVKPYLREFDPEGLGQYLGCNCTLEGKTLFKGISRLPAAAMWSWRGPGVLRKQRYFNPKCWEELPVVQEAVFFETFKETFSKILPLYFDSEQIAMSLTAGLDTRMIMAFLKREPGELPCFTFGGFSRETLDIKRAREVAQLCHQPHQVIRLQQEFFPKFPELAQETVYISDGSLDVCCSHDLYFNRIAREIAPIRMTGKFGSEVVRDRSMFKRAPLNLELLGQDCKSYVGAAFNQLEELKSGHPLTMSAFNELPWNEHGKLIVEQSQLTLRTPYMDNDLVKLFYQAPLNVRCGNHAQLRLIEDSNPGLRRILTNRGTAGSSNPVVSKFSQIFYYSLLKADYTYLYALPNWLAKLARIGASIGLERIFLGYQKFEHYRLWLRDELSHFVMQILLDERTLRRSFFNRRFLERIVSGHIHQGDNYLNEINKALTLELISRQLLEGWS